MNIVICCDYSSQSSGGAYRVAEEIAAELHNNGNNILFVNYGTKNEVINNIGIKFVRIISKGDDEVRFPLLNKVTIDFLNRQLLDFKPDIIHAHHALTLSTHIKTWANRNYIPFVYTSHEIPSSVINFIGFNKFIYYFLKTIAGLYFIRGYLNNFYLSCDGIIAINSRIYSEFAKYPIKLSIIPNGRDLKVFGSIPHKSLSKPIKLFYLGLFSHRKNQLFLLKTLKLLPRNYHLFLIGYPYEVAYLKECLNYIKVNNLKNVTILKGVKFNKIPNLIKQFHLFVSASLTEVQSLAVLEAMASGKPVVGISNYTIDEFVNTDNGAVLNNLCTPEDMALSIKDISSSESIYSQKCEKARYRVRENDINIIAHKTVAFYQEVIEEFKKEISTSKLRFVISKILVFGFTLISILMFLLYKIRDYFRNKNGDPAENRTPIAELRIPRPNR